MGGTRQFQHDFESIVLKCFSMFSVAMHGFVEKGLIVDRSLSIVFVILGEFC